MTLIFVHAEAQGFVDCIRSVPTLRLHETNLNPIRLEDNGVVCLHGPPMDTEDQGHRPILVLRNDDADCGSRLYYICRFVDIEIFFPNREAAAVCVKHVFSPNYKSNMHPPGVMTFESDKHAHYDSAKLNEDHVELKFAVHDTPDHQTLSTGKSAVPQLATRLIFPAELSKFLEKLTNWRPVACYQLKIRKGSRFFRLGAFEEAVVVVWQKVTSREICLRLTFRYSKSTSDPTKRWMTSDGKTRILGG